MEDGVILALGRLVQKPVVKGRKEEIALVLILCPVTAA